MFTGVSEVFVTDLYGKQLWRFGQFGSMPGQFREPSGVAADSCGNLVIADSKNDRIQVRTWKLCHLKHLKPLYVVSIISCSFDLKFFKCEPHITDFIALIHLT